jgi:hypothetical protein
MDMLLCQQSRSGCIADERAPLTCQDQQKEVIVTDDSDIVFKQPSLDTFTWSGMEAARDDSAHTPRPAEKQPGEILDHQKGLIFMSGNCGIQIVDAETRKSRDSEVAREPYHAVAFPEHRPCHLSYTRLHYDSVAIDRLIFPGDVLNIKGDATTSAIARLGSVGGYMGHVLVVVAPPLGLDKATQETDDYMDLWPKDDAKLWAVKVVECCSTVPGLHESTILLSVDISGKILGHGDDDGETVTRYENLDQVYLWSPPDELRNRFDADTMYVVLDEMRMNWEGYVWSWSTAVRAFLRSGDLPRENTENSQPISLAEVQDAWKVAPICTSVVVTFWQRYLEKMAVKVSIDPLSVIMQFMPLKADRVLPGELLMAMRESGWSVQDIVVRES